MITVIAATLTAASAFQKTEAFSSLSQGLIWFFLHI